MSFFRKLFTSSTESDAEPFNPHHPGPWTVVADVGCHATKGLRKAMEDEHAFFEPLAATLDHTAFFAVFDGHGGKRAAQFALAHLHERLASALPRHSADLTPELVERAWRDAYQRTDKALLAYSQKNAVNKGGPAADMWLGDQGCTAVTALLVGGVGGGGGASGVAAAGAAPLVRHLFVANAGDARALLVRRNAAPLRLTVDHNGSRNADEVARIKAAGGTVLKGRVEDKLCVTRALGDFDLKKYVIPDPHVAHVELTPNDTHLVLACDGLWDELTDQAVADILLGAPPAAASDSSTAPAAAAAAAATTTSSPSGSDPHAQHHLSPTQAAAAVTATHVAALAKPAGPATPATRYAEALVKAAMDHGCKDNCTVIVIVLNRE